MPPQRTAKRDVSDKVAPESSNKRRRVDRDATDPLHRPHHFAAEAEENGVVLRKYYPPEMSNARAQAYNDNEIPRPIEKLNAALEATAKTREGIKVRDAVMHWFKADLRVADNRALWEASQKAQAAGVPLICIYIVSPEDFEAHSTAPVRVDFVARTLHELKRDLAALEIPLYIETVEKRNDIPERIVDFMEEWDASHLFANIEYEVDELRREVKMVKLCAERGIAPELFHDTCVVPPGALQTGAGKQYVVYSPWFRSWVAHVHQNPELLVPFDPPAPNPSAAREKLEALFDCEVPDVPEPNRLPEEDAERLHAMWPAGEQAAKDRLEQFCDEKIARYGKRRDFPAEAATSSISAYLAAGTLSARTAVRTARDRNKTKKLDAGVEGITTWISEVAWRDFYKHILAHWPYVCMYKPFRPDYADIEWSYNSAHFQAWCDGRTGFPIVDAAMRQMRSIGWMHNRCRMIVASFLCKDLLLDWRMGERFFMEHLIDGDFASNNGGWGFSSSVGVDPQPYFRIFNPTLQSEKFDPDGEYIRRWVPELAAVEGKAIHDPYYRGAADQAKQAGYPPPVVHHKESRDRALKMYKEGLGRDGP
ncbi:deoxyribodipyrimidine photo-lyase [Durotheca rogersii]|uniref:deoxyribodipyrimidine photo-lyase n=1 Tax=Durotheca rogersii TaxID=419775 RepID=UPI00221F1E80|nr:deoxyribodipyrimidine photo-lyase [Durotheca rogersii]KAI5865825.1 deoxyribodipyrimidine photo-lyase [Durotheca rogersii]